MAVDQFGITILNPTKTGGREWFSKWDNGVARSLTTNTSYSFPVVSGVNQDPQDREFLALANGTADDSSITYIINGVNGICRMLTNNPGGGGSTTFRPYIMDIPLGGGGINAYDIDTASPARQTWENVEMTCYVNIRTKNEDGAIRLAARSNHHNIQNCRCDAKGYSWQLGSGPTTTLASTLGKEVIHDAYVDDATGTGAPNVNYSNRNVIGHSKMKSFTRFKAAKTYLPLNHWLGMKFILRTKTASQTVNQQGWWDQSNGLNGGNWIKIGDYVDDGIQGGVYTATNKAKLDDPVTGYWSYPGGCGDEYALDQTKHVEDPTPYANNYNPLVLRPGYACYLRIDGADMVDLKWFSIREIDPMP